MDEYGAVGGAEEGKPTQRPLDTPIAAVEEIDALARAQLESQTDQDKTQPRPHVGEILVDVLFRIVNDSSRRMAAAQRDGRLHISTDSGSSPASLRSPPRDHATSTAAWAHCLLASLALLRLLPSYSSRITAPPSSPPAAPPPPSFESLLLAALASLRATFHCADDKLLRSELADNFGVQVVALILFSSSAPLVVADSTAILASVIYGAMCSAPTTVADVADTTSALDAETDRVNDADHSIVAMCCSFWFQSILSYSLRRALAERDRLARRGVGTADLEHAQAVTESTIQQLVFLVEATTTQPVGEPGSPQLTDPVAYVKTGTGKEQGSSMRRRR
jgi:hypothetical protein